MSKISHFTEQAVVLTQNAVDDRGEAAVDEADDEGGRRTEDGEEIAPDVLAP